MADEMERPPARGDRPGGRESASADEQDGVRVQSPCDHYTDPGQLTLDDQIEVARCRRDRGIDAATHNTWSPWRRAAHRWVVDLPAGTEVTSDDVVAAVGLPLGSRNACGGFIQACLKAGLIVWTGQVCQSTRRSRHAGWIKVYRRTGGA